VSEALSIADLVGRPDWAEANVRGRPFVVYKFAATLDGRIAAADGTSQWITSAASRAEVHLLRAGCDATVVGSGTQQADDPNLAVRGNDDPRLDLSSVEAKGQPYRVIVDTAARTPATAKVLDPSAPTIIAVAPDADASHLDGLAEVIRVPRSDAGLDIAALLSALYAKDIKAVFLEGGPTLAGSFIAGRYIDRVINYIAPALLGEGKSGLMYAGIGTMAEIFRLELLHVGLSGSDVRLVARPARPKSLS
jgi:diaminohydroxyphosphoribosylaminopyrimidine deaminase/5-amino-6-(5-phosphoribosylamino)uracil reductase